MLWRFKEFPGDDAGLELFAQPGNELGRIACFQAWKNCRPKTAGLALELRMLCEKVIDQRAIRFEQRPSTSTHPTQIVECNHSQQLGWMHRGPVSEVDQLPDPLRQL